ncbi:MAG: PIN domain-containing protein [Deltaproteobacteria bacterium]|nr:PIN domain-containing protein [Deltaproteobacteria bacterium]MBI3077168.1 PIN domain-containing protein [Deltaproteobacteria bacterium]
MTLVDTSVWVDHLRRGNDQLAGLLTEEQVLSHRFVLGELACGNLRNRSEVLSLVAALPRVPVAEHEEVLHLVDSRRLYGRGLGWVDVHLLASCLLAGCGLWTLDRPLSRAAAALRLLM